MQLNVVGMSGNEVIVNVKGGATCSNTKQILNVSSVIIKLIQILP